MSKAGKDDTRVPNVYKFYRHALTLLIPVGLETAMELNLWNTLKMGNHINMFFDPKRDVLGDKGMKAETVFTFYTREKNATDENCLHHAEVAYGANEQWKAIDYKVLKTDLLKHCNAAWKDVFKKDYDPLPAAEKNEIKKWFNPIKSYISSHWKSLDDMLFANSKKLTAAGVTTASYHAFAGTSASNRSQKSNINAYGIGTHLNKLLKARLALNAFTNAVNPVAGVAADPRYLMAQSSYTSLYKNAKRRTIGRVQKQAIDYVMQNPAQSTLNVLINSYEAIKPKLSNKFILTPALIMQVTDGFVGATMSGQYVIKVWNNFAKEIYVPGDCNSRNWGAQVHFHLVFGSLYENLDVMSWAINKPDYFTNRKGFPSSCAKPDYWVLQDHIPLIRGSNPLKSAAVGLGFSQGNVTQMSTLPSMAGRRAKLDKYEQIGAAFAANVKTATMGPQSTGGLFDDLFTEMETYRARTEEGTTGWFNVVKWNGKGDDDANEVDCDVSTILMFYG